MVRENLIQDSVGMNRRRFLKAAGATFGSAAVLSGSASAVQCNTENQEDSSSTWAKELSIFGQQSVTLDGSCNYRIAFDRSGQVAKTNGKRGPDLESSDYVYNRCYNGTCKKEMAGEVKNGYNDKFYYDYDSNQDPFVASRFYTDTEVFFNLNDQSSYYKQHQWKLSIEGDAAYYAEFADNTAPDKGSNADAGDSTGVIDGRGYVDGSVNDGGYDDFWVYGDITYLYVYNIGDNSTTSYVDVNRA